MKAEEFTQMMVERKAVRAKQGVKAADSKWLKRAMEKAANDGSNCLEITYNYISNELTLGALLNPLILWWRGLFCIQWDWARRAFIKTLKERGFEVSNNGAQLFIKWRNTNGHI